MQHTECTSDVNWLEQSFGPLGGASCWILNAGGPELVLLHGVTRQWRDYRDVMPGLAALGKVTALEHRGHGASSKGERYRGQDFVDDALAWLQARSEPVGLLGHSLGAMPAAMVAARAPDRITAQVLEDPPGSYLAERIAESRYWLQFNNLRNLLRQSSLSAEALANMEVQHPADGRVVPWSTLRSPKALQFAAECLGRMDPAVLDALIAGQWLAGVDWFGELSHIRCPTLLLRSDPQCGGMLSEAEAALIQSRIPHCGRIDNPGHEHNLHGTAPARKLDLVNRFLQSHIPPLRLSRN